MVCSPMHSQKAPLSRAVTVLGMTEAIQPATKVLVAVVMTALQSSRESNVGLAGSTVRRVKLSHA